MAAMIYFTTLLLPMIILGFLAIPAHPRTFPGGEKAVVIVYERSASSSSSSSSSSLALELSTILSAINHHEEEENSNSINDMVMVINEGSGDEKVEAPPIPKPPLHPSPKPAPSIGQLTSADDEEGCSSDHDCISMVTAAGSVVPRPRKTSPPPPPAPKPATPTHPTI